MSDREEFEAYIRTWLWSINATLERFGHGYASKAVQVAWQCWMESRRSGFVSSGYVDLELP